MKRIATLAAIGLACLAGSAAAGEIRPYTAQTFDALASAGTPVVVDVSAGWCPTCKAQKPIIDSLMRQPAYSKVTLLTVDFDRDKAALQRFGVSMQSTLIGYKGGKEVGRSVGDTTRSGLEGLVRKTVD